MTHRHLGFILGSLVKYDSKSRVGSIQKMRNTFHSFVEPADMYP